MSRSSLNFQHITLLQTFAVLCVIIGHALSPFVYKYLEFYVTNSSSIFSSIRDFIYSFHMPLFFFISGYLYAVKNKLNWPDYNIKRFKRLIIPFCIAGYLIYAAILAYVEQAEFNLYTHTQNYFLLKNTGHLWFLPVMFCSSLMYTFFMSTPLKKYPFILLVIILICHRYNVLLPHIYLQKAVKYMLYIHLGYIFAIKNIRYSHKVPFYLFIGWILYVLFIDFQLQLRFLYTPCYLSILFYFLADFIIKNFPRLGCCSLIELISVNMFTIYIISEPITLFILKSINYSEFTPINLALILNIGTILPSLILAQFYNSIKQQLKHTLSPSIP